MKQKFILIGGMPRSGTNLARRIIGSHSLVALPPLESLFLGKHSLGRSVEEILSTSRVHALDFDVSDLYLKDSKEAFITFFTRYAQHENKQIPGDKTPYNEFYFDLAREWLAEFDIKFIHMLRNPLSVMASYKKAPFVEEKKYWGMPALARNWVRSTTLGLAQAIKWPENYHVVKFEELTSSSSETAAKICEFIGLEFEKERMLSLSDYKEHRDNTSFQDKNTEKAGAEHTVWAPADRSNFLSNRERALTMSICGELAFAIGYRQNDFSMRRPEKICNPVDKFKERVARNLRKIF